MRAFILADVGLVSDPQNRQDQIRYSYSAAILASSKKLTTKPMAYVREAGFIEFFLCLETCSVRLLSWSDRLSAIFVLELDYADN